jgi:hypothetical protein
MASTLATIAKACGAGNAKGLKGTLYIANKDDVATIPAAGAGTHLVSTNMTMESTKKFYKWEFSKIDHDLQITSEGDQDANTFKSVLTFLVPKVTAANTYILGLSATGCEYIVIVEDKNGNKRIIGDLVDGAILKVNEKVKDKNGYECTLEWESALPPLFYTGTITT